MKIWAVGLTGGVAHYARYFCIDRCRFYFSSCTVLEVELESACLSGQGCGLCIALIRPNHWAASVAQWLEHLSSKQCVVGSNPTRAALFSFRRKKSCLG